MPEKGICTYIDDTCITLYHTEKIIFLHPKHISCDMNIYRSLLNSTGQSFTTFYKLVHLQPVVELPFWLTILNAFFPSRP